MHGLTDRRRFGPAPIRARHLTDIGLQLQPSPACHALQPHTPLPFSLPVPMNTPTACTATTTTTSRISTILHQTSSLARQVFTTRALARLLSTFLCSVIITIRPFSRFGGQYAFLVLALKELVFSVQENLAQQLELTCLNILGALVGIGLSTLAKYLAALTGPDSVAARSICAVFLILISFAGEHLGLEIFSR